uniref:EF-hand calcium-binding domain-containing protein 7-like n=1 Tax=Styela clava TaxID=7725 RepID=UPI001939A12C|nr:EF-hand calcium-binding domain-containing protein 7-like [Styela clava]
MFRSQSSVYNISNKQHHSDADEELFKSECEAAYLSVIDSTKIPIDSKKLLKRVLQQAGRNPSEKQISKIWTSKTDTVTYAEYCDILNEMKSPSRDDLLSAFKKIDSNRDGFISHSELHEVLTSQGEKMTEMEVRKIIDDADVNRDGKLDYEEFCTLMLTTSHRCQQANFKQLKQKKADSNLRPISASSFGGGRRTPRAAQRTLSMETYEKENTVSSKKEVKSSSHPSSARKSSTPEVKLDNAVQIRMAAPLDKKSNLFIPKGLKNWNRLKTKGCFYLDNDDGKVQCHEYSLVLSSASKVWLTIKPYSLSTSREIPRNPVDTCMMILRRSTMSSENTELIGLTDLRNNTQYCWKGDLRAGSYILLPFTSGCRLFRRRKEPDEEIPLLRKDHNDEVQLSRAFRETLSDMFEMCDLDGNGLLNREEFNCFQILTTDEKVDDEAWQIVQDNFEMKKGELTREGFIQLHLMQAREENVDVNEDLLDTLMCMGYNKALDLDQACPFEVEAHAADCQPHLSLLTLGMGNDYTHTQELILQSILQQGEKQTLKNLQDINWYVYKNDGRISSVLENNVSLFKNYELISEALNQYSGLL